MIAKQHGSCWASQARQVLLVLLGAIALLLGGCPTGDTAGPGGEYT